MKKYLLITLILCGAVLFSACGRTEPSPVFPSAAPSEESSPETAAPSEGTGAETESAAWTPDGPVTMIVAYKVGSGTDNTARVLTKFAEKYIGQSVEIENMDGGSGSDGFWFDEP